MFRRVTIAGSALVVLAALGWELSILAESSALAQQPGQQQVGQQQAAASQPAQKQAPSQPTSQPTTQATQPAQGKLVVQFGGSAGGSKPTPEELQALARAAEEWVRNNPKGKTAASEKPVVQQNQERGMPPEEREAIGLPAPTWVAKHGKVQPAVRETLVAQKKLIESKDPMAEFQSDRPVGFQGTAYVDIYLRHETKGQLDSKEHQAAVKEVQDRILCGLSASEFSLFFAFKDTAGLVGFVDDSGLKKLIEDAGVLAVGLDDQQRPQDVARVMSEDIPGIREKAGKTDTKVYKALEASKDGYVYVGVNPNRPTEWHISDDEEETRMREMEDRILASLSAEEFKPRSRGGGPYGYANAAGLAKLEAHPDVRGVFLPGRLRLIQ